MNLKAADYKSTKKIRLAHELFTAGKNSEVVALIEEYPKVKFFGHYLEFCEESFDTGDEVLDHYFQMIEVYTTGV